MSINNIVKEAIDLHYHIGPEVIPRKYCRVEDLVINQRGKIRGLALKNHFYPTLPFTLQKKGSDLILLGSVTLNNFVGGLNPEAIYAASLISERPIIVWFPTIDSQNFLNKTKYQIPNEWVIKEKFKARLSSEIKGISCIDRKGKLKESALAVLKTIKKCNSILATGHISCDEIEVVVKKALELKIKKIIITHPIYQKINMPVERQIRLARLGCFIEVCYSMYAIDKIPIKKIAEQILKIGEKNIIISSDVGQVFSPDSSEALKDFALRLKENGITEGMLYSMMVKNPLKIIE